MAPEPTEAFARSRQHVAGSRIMLAASRHRIAASRRLLNPYFAVAGASAPGPARIRSLISSGRLFPLSEGMRVLAGRGTAKPCVVCQEVITASEVEYEVRPATRGSFFCHLPCFTAWKRESLDISGVWPV